MQIAVLGYGVVGSGVVEVLNENSTSIKNKTSDEINIKKILDIRDFSDSQYADLFTDNVDEIFEDPEIEIVVETIGGLKVAYDFTKRALENKKHVVTSNKELVATCGPELLQLARENSVNYLFEASVGGGIPIIRPLNQCLSANRIEGIIAILNGTTNYILTKMRCDGTDLNEALEKAKSNGYAEADPSSDIEGYDTCRKIAILSSIAFDKFIDYRNIYTEGISNLSITDMDYADKMDSVIKLLAVSKRCVEGILCQVSPVIIKKDHPLARVEDVFNAVVIQGNAIGEAMFYGRGAGKLPTASAVVADIIDIVNCADSSQRMAWDVNDSQHLVPIDRSSTRLFVRAHIGDKQQAKKEINKYFSNVDYVSLAGKEDEVAFVTPEMMEKDINAKIDRLLTCDSINSIENKVRVIWS